MKKVERSFFIGPYDQKFRKFKTINKKIKLKPYTNYIYSWLQLFCYLQITNKL